MYLVFFFLKWKSREEQYIFSTTPKLGFLFTNSRIISDENLKNDINLVFEKYAKSSPDFFSLSGLARKL